MKIDQYFKSSLLILFICISCSKVQNVADVIIQPTEREIYARNFEESDSIYSHWISEFELSKLDSLQIKLPYIEQGSIISDRLETYSYNIDLNEGERLIIEFENIPDSSKVFVNLYLNEVFEKNEDSQIYEGLANSERMVILDNGTDETYKLILQPEQDLDTEYLLKIYTEPVYAFPVAGHTNKSIKSFWGAERDGGRRFHKGVDIFAKRGTPVIAVVKGRVSKTGNYGLGGKQVWVRESIFGNSLYYAHLDSVATKRGTKVNIGDTLGFVGNTGNAKTTAPHLHFGIYKGYRGAVNPLPYIKESELLEYNTEDVGLRGLLNSKSANIRQGPSTKFDIIFTTTEKIEVSILGKTDDWFHIILPNGVKAFAHESLINEIEEEIVL